ncbi:hypothetical protein AwErysi_01550 [Erysipelotrichaceae bacterium]|nr:hypothetical protein AwErysi_01550 [Erysipelotrichaceae bacterium]
MNVLFFSLYIVIFIAVFYMYTRIQQQRQEQKLENQQRGNLIAYTAEIEIRLHEMRQFRHDYQNVLSSFERFIHDEDLAGLQTYYRDEIKPIFLELESNTFEFEQLNKIQITPLKSILFSKYMEAKHQKIAMKIEVLEQITTIESDTLAYIRAIGILLANAIEAAQGGTIRIACFEKNQQTHLIVANTYQDILPTIAEMKMPGFSTKGVNRGQGIPIIFELMRKNPGMQLETSITPKLVTQTLILK